MKFRVYFEITTCDYMDVETNENSEAAKALVLHEVSGFTDRATNIKILGAEPLDTDTHDD